VEDTSSIRQVRQIFIDRPEFFIGHSSDRPPWHLLAELVAVGIDPVRMVVTNSSNFHPFTRLRSGPSGAN
jgi:hypothetical protein